MKVYVQHAKQTEGFSPTANSTIWYDLKTIKGVMNRCHRTWPGEKFRVEVLHPINIYRKPFLVIEF